MTQTNKTCDCLIIGGGFTGLSAALKLVKAGKSVRIIESDQSVGGLAGGFMMGEYEIEKFYHHWFISDTYVTDLAEEIGARENVITRPSRTGMYFAGGIYRLSTPLDLLKFKALSFPDRIRTGIATIALRREKDWKRLEKITSREWLSKYFGERVYKVMWEPLLYGKFGKYADDIAAVWFWKKLDLRGSSRGKGGSEALAYYRGGFAALARDVAAKVVAAGGELHTSERAISVSRESDGVRVETDKGVHTARSVLVTTPFPIAADLLESATSADYAARLRRIQYLANICLVLELDRSLSDTYWLNVNDPSFPFVGVIEHTNFEPPESYGGRHIVFLSKYLPADEPFYAMDADAAFEYALPHLQRMFPEFDTSWVKGKHVWKSDHAQPIVECNYSAMLPGADTPVPHVFISTMAQVYPEDRGTNYAIREGRNAADLIISDLDATAATASLPAQVS